jgi:ComF family protein
MTPLGLLLPQRCAVCARPGRDALCDGCASALVRLGPTGCARCGAPGPWPVRRCAECGGRRLAFATARAAIAYDARARLLVRAWKEGARRTLAPVLAALVVEVVPRPAAEALAPVPADRRRARTRGHAPAGRLALALGEAWEIPVRDLLARTRDGPRQAGLLLAERRRNVRGVFAAAVPDVPRHVCVVDDVYTTGATVNACATALRRAGARRVEAVCLARAVR